MRQTTHHTTRTARGIAGLAVATAALTLTACSSASSRTAAAATTAAAAAAATTVAAATAAPAPGGDVPSYAATSAAAAGGDNVQSNSSDGSTPAPVVNPDVLPPDSTRQIIYTASMTVETKDIAAAVKAAVKIASDLGGRVDSQRIVNGTDGGRQATLTLKVPPARYDNGLSSLSALGTQRSLEQTSEDVTGKVVDLESRAKTERVSIDRIRALMDKATSIRDVVTLEGELTNREATLESALAQAQSLRGLSAMGTITLTLVQPGEIPPPVKPAVHHTGFGAGLHNGWRAFTGFVVGTLTVLGAVAPFAVPLLLIGGGWLLLRRRRRVLPPTVVEPTTT